MLTFNYDNEKELLKGIQNGEVQQNIYDYIKEINMDIDLYKNGSITLGPAPTREDVIEYFDIEYSEENKYYSDEDIANRKDAFASQFADLIISVFDRYQKDKEANLLKKECTITKDLPALAAFKTLSTVIPFSTIQKGYYLDTIMNYGFSYTAADTLYYFLERGYLKTDDDVSLDTIVNKTLLAIESNVINAEDIQNMNSTDLVDNVLNDFASLEPKKGKFR